MKSVAIINSRGCAGVDAPAVTIEVHLSNGLPRLNIVGLPEKEVKESKDRVRSAIINSGFEFPIKRITVNLAPADLPKEGGRFDLPIALGILAASNQIPNQLSEYEFAGELALAGALRPIRGALPFSIATASVGRHLVLPQQNADEAALPEKSLVYAAQHLLEVCAHLTNTKPLTLYHNKKQYTQTTSYPDLKEVKGQARAKRALEIAAAGGHSLLLIGPPGTGKTMLATRLPGVLPPLNQAESLEVAAIYSISNRGFNHHCWSQRPFRAPHHTASSVALVGGGSPPRPGEISLAHQGVLFLDELPEFNRHVLEALREPVEVGAVTISRAAHQSCFPANFQLIAAMNPCPCGYFGEDSGRCHCTSEQVLRYQKKISGPLMDRIDMHVEVPPLPSLLLFDQENIFSESSATVRDRVLIARERQVKRTRKPNALLKGSELLEQCKVAPSDQTFLQDSMSTLNLSARALHRLLKLSRTIADLDHKENILRLHLEEALSYRLLERFSASSIA